MSFWLNKRKIPTLRFTLVSALIGGIIMSILTVATGPEFTSAFLLFCFGAAGMFISILYHLVWRGIIICYEIVQAGKKGPIIYKEADALVLIKQHISQPWMEVITLEQFTELLNIYHSNRQDETRTHRALEEAGSFRITKEQVEEIFDAELIYLRQIGAAK